MKWHEGTSEGRREVTLIEGEEAISRIERGILVVGHLPAWLSASEYNDGVQVWDSNLLTSTIAPPKVTMMTMQLKLLTNLHPAPINPHLFASGVKSDVPSLLISSKQQGCSGGCSSADAAAEAAALLSDCAMPMTFRTGRR